MQKHLIEVSVLFMAISLIQVMITGSVQAVCLFGIASLVFAFLTYLNRKKVEDLDQIKADISELKQKVSLLHSLGL